jgi:hypothetical protein
MMTPAIVMACPDLFPGFVPAIHVFDLGLDHGMDARHKPALGLDPRGRA